MVRKFVNGLTSKAKALRKEEKGFSLVELIVVIVILAILIGVTIGGVYGYVNQSRVNTDVNNAATIQSTCGTLAVDKDVYKWANTDAEKTITLTWTASDASTGGTWSDSKDGELATGITLKAKIGALLTDGLPVPKAADHFTLKFTGLKGDVTVTCKAYSSTDNTTELKGEE